MRVSETPLARRQAKRLRGKVADAYDAALLRLEDEGCAAADYRLTGETVERICALHLPRDHRLLVCFPQDDHAAVVLVSKHRRGSATDAYESLYAMLDIPEPGGRRTKPPCCEEDGEPPIDTELFDQLIAAARRLRRRA